MRRKLLFWVLFYFTSLLFSNLSAQVITKNGMLFRSHDLNHEHLASNQVSRPYMLNNFSGNGFGDSITVIKPDFLVNDIGGSYGAQQYEVSPAIDGEGNYACVWIDDRNGYGDIYAQFFNNKSEKIGRNLKVNKNPIEGDISPFIAANKNGDFIIVWVQNSYSVMAQKYTKDGQEVGGNILVNSTNGSSSTLPCVNINNDGSFIVMWAAGLFPNGNRYQIYVRLFNKDCTPATSDIGIIDEPRNGISSYNQGRHITSDSMGNYVVVWSSHLNAEDIYSGIYGQKINRNGQKEGLNFLISSSTAKYDNSFPEIASTDDGYYFAAWNNETGICARIFNDSGFITDVFNAGEMENSWMPFGICSDQENKFIISLQGKDGPLFKIFDKYGNSLEAGKEIKFNTLITKYYFTKRLTDIVNDKLYAFSATNDRGDPDIYVQKFDSNLDPAGDFIKINDDAFSSFQVQPIIRFNKYGESIVLWLDYRNGRDDLYAQVYDKNFNRIGVNIQINDSTDDLDMLLDKRVQCLSDGTFVIAFSISDVGLFLQLVNTKGEKAGGNILIKSSDYLSLYNISLNINSKDEILLCWYGQYCAYLRKYNKVLYPLSAEYKFMQAEDGTVFHPLGISIDPDLNIFAAWFTENIGNNINYEGELKGKFFNDSGQSLSEEFVIEKNYPLGSYGLSVCNDKNNFAVVYNTSDGIYLKRRYNLDGEFEFSNSLNFPESFYTSDIIKFTNGKIFYTFASKNRIFAFYADDNKRTDSLYILHTFNYSIPDYDQYGRSNNSDYSGDKLFLVYQKCVTDGTGHDIWGKVFDTGEINFEKGLFFKPQSSDVIHANYPNPFNSSTKIVYEILAKHKVKLSIYDIIGREVKVLADTDQEKGIYEVNFDASNFPSGIYFCRLEAFDTSVRKMVLIK